MGVPCISVVVPVYNVEQYLGECLDSILSQTEKNLEIICVNDGATDGSRNILEEYRARDGRISIIDRENGGLSAARNTGLRAAKGKYIYFLDSDDAIESNAMKTCRKLADRKRLDLLIFDAEAVYENEELKSEFPNYKTYYIRREAYGGVFAGAEMLRRMVGGGEYRVQACTHFFKRSLIEDNGLIFPEGLLFEDNCFTFMAMMLAKRCLHISDRFFRRRVRAQSIMTSAAYQNRIYSSYYVYKYIRDAMTDPRIEPLLKKPGMKDCADTLLESRKAYAREILEKAAAADIEKAERRMPESDLADFRAAIYNKVL